MGQYATLPSGSNMYLKSLVLVCVVAQVYGDRNLPVLFQFSQPTHNVAVFRGADLEKAKAAGLLKGFGAGGLGSGSGAASYSAPTTTPAPPPPVTTYAPATTAAPTTTAAPATTAAPKVYSPAPSAYRPAPVVYKPAPIVYKPAPAPIVYKPAPAPVVYKPAPAPIVYKPAPTPAPVSYKPAASYVEPVYNDADAVYTWEYAVKDDYTSNDFGHKESRDGAHTEGVYYVALPDGRLQTVTYAVDGYGGYVPLVEYAGEAQYPDTKPYSA